MSFTDFFLILIFVFWLALAIRYFCTILIPLWRESFLYHPVLIIESDDWSPGPLEDAEILGQLNSVLKDHLDYRGHPAVMTLGIVLSTPYEIYTNREGVDKIRRHFFTDTMFKDLAEAIKRGEKTGCFSLQLHAMDHFWPALLVARAKENDAILSWVNRTPFPRTEDLSSQLQGRWARAEKIPAERLTQADIDRAVLQEVDAFKRFSGRSPKVVVPPAFMWTKSVESAWEKAGIKIVVTPGRRFESYDEKGRPHPCREKVRNGDKSKSGLIYVIRDNYFEPSFGHKAEKAISALFKKTAVGRPTLIETHRFNFIQNPPATENAVKELDILLGQSLSLFPDLMFLSTEKLASMISKKDPSIVAKSFVYKLPLWLARIEEDKHYSLSGLLSGLAPIFVLAHRVIQLVLKNHKQMK